MANEPLQRGVAADGLVSAIKPEPKATVVSRSDVPGELAAGNAPARIAHRCLVPTLAQLGDGFVVFDRDWHYTFVNPAAARLLNKSAEELLGRVVWEVYPEARSLPLYEHFFKAVKEQVPIQFEVYHPGLGWFEYRCQPTGDGLAVYFSDITRRKVMEETLRISERRLELACAAAHLGIWDWDLPSGQIVWNKEHYLIWGLDDAKFVPTPENVEQFFHPDDRAGVWAALNEAMQSGKSFEYEFRIIRPDGEVRWLLVIGRAFYDNRGLANRMIGTVRDVTRRKNSEQELERLRAELEEVNTQLERKVLDRTAKLQETISELDRFSYALTHDMRGPLRAMRGFSDLLVDECSEQLDAEHKSMLLRIGAAATRLDGLIVDALQYNKSIRTEFTLHSVDVSSLLHEMVQSYSQFHPPVANIAIIDPMPLVLGNKAALTQCFSNLLNNAVKFVQAGRVPVVKVWAQRLGDSVRIWFEDNGIGIAPERHQQIWQMFERLSQDYPGNGIGLALVRKLVEQMKGTCGVESTPGEGSRFWIQLPAVISK